MKSLKLARIALIVLIVTTLLGIIQTVAFGNETVVKNDDRRPPAAELATGNQPPLDDCRAGGYLELEAWKGRSVTTSSANPSSTAHPVPI